MFRNAEKNNCLFSIASTPAAQRRGRAFPCSPLHCHIAPPTACFSTTSARSPLLGLPPPTSELFVCSLSLRFLPPPPPARSIDNEPPLLVLCRHAVHRLQTRLTRHRERLCLLSLVRSNPSSTVASSSWCGYFWCCRCWGAKMTVAGRPLSQANSLGSSHPQP